MIRERHRRELLKARRTERRFKTAHSHAQNKFWNIIREAHAEGAQAQELADLVDLSIQRIKQILYNYKD